MNTDGPQVNADDDRFFDFSTRVTQSTERWVTFGASSAQQA